MQQSNKSRFQGFQESLLLFDGYFIAKLRKAHQFSYSKWVTFVVLFHFKIHHINLIYGGILCSSGEKRQIHWLSSIPVFRLFKPLKFQIRDFQSQIWCLKLLIKNWIMLLNTHNNVIDLYRMYIFVLYWTKITLFWLIFVEYPLFDFVRLCTTPSHHFVQSGGGTLYLLFLYITNKS